MQISIFSSNFSLHLYQYILRKKFIKKRDSLWSEPKMLDKKFNILGSFFMSKYSNEFKFEVINYYKKGNGFLATAKHFNIPAI